MIVSETWKQQRQEVKTGHHYEATMQKSFGKAQTRTCPKAQNYGDECLALIEEERAAIRGPGGRPVRPELLRNEQWTKASGKHCS